MTEPSKKDAGREQRLRRWFGELRAEDERAAPPFDRVLSSDGVPGPERSSSGWKRTAAAAALLLLACGVAFFAAFWPRRPAPRPDQSAGPLLTANEPPLIPWQTSVLISEWQSPTAFLLRVPEPAKGNAGDFSRRVRRGQ